MPIHKIQWFPWNNLRTLIWDVGRVFTIFDLFPPIIGILLLLSVGKFNLFFDPCSPKRLRVLDCPFSKKSILMLTPKTKLNNPTDTSCTNIEVMATLDCPQLCMLCHVIHRHNTKNHCYCAECRRGASVAGDGSANTVRRRRRIGSLVFCLGYLLRHVMGREFSHPDLRLHHRLLQRQVVESLCSVLAQDRHCASHKLCMARW